MEEYDKTYLLPNNWEDGPKLWFFKPKSDTSGWKSSGSASSFEGVTIKYENICNLQMANNGETPPHLEGNLYMLVTPTIPKLFPFGPPLAPLGTIAIDTFETKSLTTPSDGTPSENGFEYDQFESCVC